MSWVSDRQARYAVKEVCSSAGYPAAGVQTFTGLLDFTLLARSGTFELLFCDRLAGSYVLPAKTNISDIGPYPQLILK